MQFVILGDIASDVMHRRYFLKDSEKAYVTCGGSGEMMKSGIAELDGMLGAFVDGALYVIGGSPAMGKTALIIEIAVDVVASTTKPVFILSLDMTAEHLIQRMISRIVNIDQQTVRSGNLTDYQRNIMSILYA